MTGALRGRPGLEQPRCAKAPARRAKASGLDKTTGPRAQDSLPRQDACCTNLEIDEEDDWRITPKGIRTRIVAGASSLDPPLALL